MPNPTLVKIENLFPKVMKSPRYAIPEKNRIIAIKNRDFPRFNNTSNNSQNVLIISKF